MRAGGNVAPCSVTQSLLQLYAVKRHIVRQVGGTRRRICIDAGSTALVSFGGERRQAKRQEKKGEQGNDSCKSPCTSKMTGGRGGS